MKIFLSGVSSEFRECRTSLASDLRAMGAEVMLQEDLQQGGRSLLEKLQSYIEFCDRVIYLLGDTYGYEAPISGGGPAPRSYTQWEYFFAMGEKLDGRRAPAKEIYLYVADAKFHPQSRLIQSEEHERRQKAFADMVLSSGYDRGRFSSLDALCRLALRDGFHLPTLPQTSPDVSSVHEYLRSLRSRLDQIDIGSPVQRVNSVATPLRHLNIIEAVCTRPRVRRILKLADSPDGIEVSETQREAFAGIGDAGRRQVILGHPGSGKTTLARWLVIRYAQDFLEGRSFSVPIYLPLREVALSSIGSLDDLIETATKLQPTLPAEAEVRRFLRENRNRLSLIIDGLDELPAISAAGEARAESISRLYGILDEFIDSSEGHQVVITSRIQDYLHNPEFQYSGAVCLLVDEMSIDQIKESILNWHRMAGRLASGDPDNADWLDRASRVFSLVQGNTDLASFVANPLCLNLLQMVYDDSELPYLSISRICEMAVRTLLRLRVEPKAPARDMPTDISHEQYLELLLSVLSDIAVAATDSIAGGGDGTVPLDEVQARVSACLGATTAKGFLARGALIHPIMLDLVRGHGVLISMNAQCFMFAHALFRDTLVGRALTQRGQTEYRDRASSLPWSKAFRHVAGLALADRGPSLAAVDLANALFQDYTRSRDTVMLASAAEIVGELNISSDVLSGALFGPFLAQIRVSLLEAATDRTAPAERRLLLGMLLGRVGDPRLAGTLRANNGQADGKFVRLPAAKVTLGAAMEPAITNPKYVSVFPRLVENLAFEEFSISRFLVTNAEYADFVSDGGYTTDVYWSDNGGVQWLHADGATLDRLRELMRTTSMTHFYTDLNNGRVSEAEISDAIDAMLLRKLPLYWFNHRLNGPNQPVVGVNWWEAKAYARWYSLRRAGHDASSPVVVDLPTEYEWERAARLGPRNDTDTIWAAGSATENAHWNALHRLPPGSAPVGLYPWGSPAMEGPHDLIGNVWEWTTSTNRPYAVAYIHQADDGYGLADRIVRGGSWLSSESLSSTISFRSFDPPCNAYDDLGFRIAATRRS
ncbi:SUMF1/EgtB/PvdO family nonheme iron enzyme [Actinoplanes friuliensis]|uniref:NACHT domain-containing protein n=1 Tax=Actinoplanes friuliensis DSM 7358 TaxID=1246995 RepID=U5VVS7_9ACTN|nr:SUMF1/EgtB/PvdO family nonheme iron enzyme [Actinoplanes friuliensis]AGZ41063.1 hypothetical protein AFR_13885 [Actinoplanes friuliensis DSM 7358]